MVYKVHDALYKKKQLIYLQPSFSLFPESDCFYIFIFSLGWCVCSRSSRLGVLCISPPVPHSFSYSSKGSSFLEVSRASRCVRRGRRERKGDQREVQSEGERRHLRERDARTMTNTVMHPLSFPLCLIMSLLMLILPTDASHLIKALTFACNSHTSDGVPISFRVQEMRARGISYEQLILSPHRAEEAAWFVLVLSVMITSCRLCSDVKERMCFFRC